MNHDEAIHNNMTKLNEHLDQIHGNLPTEVAMVHASMANVFALGALVEAVRELTGEVRKLREGGTSE